MEQCITVTSIDNGFLSSATVSLLPSKEGYYYYFNRLYVYPKNRGQGIATRLMNELCQKLDMYEIDVFLDINPYGDLNYEQLVVFYKKFDFVESQNEDFQFLRKARI